MAEEEGAQFPKWFDRERLNASYQKQLQAHYDEFHALAVEHLNPGNKPFWDHTADVRREQSELRTHAFWLAAEAMLGAALKAACFWPDGLMERDRKSLRWFIHSGMTTDKTGKRAKKSYWQHSYTSFHYVITWPE